MRTFPNSAPSAASRTAVAKYNATTEQAFSGVHDFPKPTIAMIRGYCIGGGMALATCCDIRICTPGSKFGIPAAKLGLGYDYKGIRRLMNVVGPSFAKEIFFTARQFDAEEARMMGFVNRVVPDAGAGKLCEELRPSMIAGECAADHRAR